MKKAFFIISGLAAILIIAAGVYYLTQEAKEPVFTNPNGKYSFNYPLIWKAAINQYNNNNSLFGPDATSAVGLGGVEVFPNQTIDEFIGGVSAEYMNRTDVVIDGVNGIREQYKAFPLNGEHVVLLKDGNIYNIYINSEKNEDINLFNRIISSFKFIH